MHPGLALPFRQPVLKQILVLSSKLQRQQDFPGNKSSSMIILFHESQQDIFVPFFLAAPQEEVLSALEAKGILGGLPVEGGVLWCATEKQSKAELDRAIAIVKEVLAK